MSLPQNIGNRRRSIAKLTRSPMLLSPMSPSLRGSHSNSFSANAPFRKLVRGELDTQSNSSSGENVFHNTDDETDDQDFSHGIDDPKLIELVSRHLNSNPSLDQEGADITRDLYRLDPKPRLGRSKSFDSERSSRKGSFASSLNVPGGFRRDFVVQRNAKKTPNLITSNFVEFLSIYGHFAGESLESDDDIACHYQLAPRPGADEESALLENKVNPSGTATDTKAYFLLLKAFVGTGVLFLPKAFANGGLAFSVLTLLFFGFLSFWCYLILVHTKTATKVSGFGEIGLKLYGKYFQRIILFSIILSQVGFVAAYIVFTAENLRAFSANISGYLASEMPIYWFIAFQVVVLLPLSLIRDITKLSLLALLANVFILVGLLTIVYYTFYEYAVHNHFSAGPDLELLFNQAEFSLFIGVAIFAFEGIGLIIPIQESMVYPDHFPKVLFQVIATISAIFIFIGTLGYVTFGKDVQTVIILNLPQNSPLVILVQLLYGFAILLSTPIQLFPAIRLIEQKLFPSHKSGKHSAKIKWLKNVQRCLFVLFTALIALYGGKNLNRFVSFVGCFACIPLVYMYPPILHLKGCCNYSEDTDKEIIRKKYWLGILDYFLVAIGTVAVVYTTYDIVAH